MKYSEIIKKVIKEDGEAAAATTSADVATFVTPLGAKPNKKKKTNNVAVIKRS